MKIAVGICNYNRAEDVCRAVQAALGQSLPPYAVAVLDNASTDDSVARLRDAFDKRIDILKLPENRGGAGGFRALSQSLLETPCDAIALVDSDCFLDPGALQQLTAALEARPSLGAVGPRIMHADEPSRIQECGAFLDWEQAAFRLHRSDHIVDGPLRLPQTEPVDYVPACALLARRAVFEKIGHFDADYFIYFDDIDWCQRARDAGFGIATVPEAAAVHRGGGKRKRNHFPTYYFWRNRYRFFARYAPAPRAMSRFLIEDAARAIATCHALEQARAAAVLHRALSDAAAGRFGPARFAPGELELDPPSPYLVTDDCPETAINVEHIFNDPGQTDSQALLQDRFGKRLRRHTQLQLAPDYRLKFEETKALLAQALGW